MTDIEAERAELLRYLDDGHPVTPAIRERIAAVVAADAVHPPTALDLALREALERIVALRGGSVPVGLRLRHRRDRSGMVDVFAGSRLVGCVSVAALLARADEIERPTRLPN